MVNFGKIEVGLVKLDVFRNYWTVQFREISSQVKSPNFGYPAYRAYRVIRPVGVQLGWFHSSKSYSKAFRVSQCCWFSYRSLSGVLFILQALTPGRETILQGNRTERLESVRGLYVLNDLGCYVYTSIVIKYFTYILF